MVYHACQNKVCAMHRQTCGEAYDVSRLQSKARARHHRIREDIDDASRLPNETGAIHNLLRNDMDGVSRLPIRAHAIRHPCAYRTRQRRRARYTIEFVWTWMVYRVWPNWHMRYTIEFILSSMVYRACQPRHMRYTISVAMHSMRRYTVCIEAKRSACISISVIIELGIHFWNCLSTRRNDIGVLPARLPTRRQ